METLYRKVQFEINHKEHDEIWLIGKSANFIFNPNTRNGEELFDFLSCCEETPDNTQQIEKLEAEKKELLSILKGLVSDVGNLIGEHDIEWQQAGYFESAKEIIQKHKQ